MFNLIDGVSVFFVLSGFLVGKILIKEFLTKEISLFTLLNFWKRRWLRTLPSYFLVLTLVLTLSIVTHNQIDLSIIEYLFFVQNFTSEHPTFFPEAWSLSVEEWFYLLFPALVFLQFLLFKRNKEGLFLASILCFLVLPFVLRTLQWNENQEVDLRKIVIYRLDAIVYGVLVAYLFFRFNLNLLKYKIHLLCVGLILVFVLLFNPFNWKAIFPPVNYPLESLSFGLFIPFLVDLKKTTWNFANQFIQFMSTRSYGLYLVNLSLVQGIIPIHSKLKSYFFMDSPLVPYLLFWIFSLLIADFIYRFFEKPILNWRDKR